MPYFFTEDGQRVFVEPERAAEAWKSGELGLPGGRVNVVSPSGKAGTVPTESVGLVLDKGWRIEEQQEQVEREYGDKDVKAFAAGAARGATLGLSDMVLTKTGLVDPATLDKLSEANPVSSGIGEVTGAIGSSFIPAGGQVSLATKILRGVSAPSRLVAKAGSSIAGGVEGELLRYLTKRGVSKTLAKAGSITAGEMATTSIAKQAMARSAAFAASGAVEGSLYGVAQAIDEKTLGDPATVGELLVAHVGPAAIASGMIGGLFGAASPLAGSGLKKLTSVASEKIGEAAGMSAGLEAFARKRAVKGLHSTQSKMGKLEELGLTDEVGKDLLASQEALGGKQVLANNVRDTLGNIKTVREDTGKKIGALLDELDTAAGGAPVGGANIAKRLRTELLSEIADQPGYETERKLIEGFADEFDQLGDMSLRKANQVKTRIQKKVERLFGKEIDSPANTLRTQIAGVVRDEVDTAAAFVAKSSGRADLSEKFLEAKRLYRTMSEAEKLAKHGVKRIEGNRTLSLTDYLSGVGGAAAGAMTGNVAPLLMAGAASVGNKFARERGNLLLAKTADKAAKLRVLQQRVEMTTERIDSAIDRFVTQQSGKLRLASSFILSDITGKSDRREAAKEFAAKLHRYVGNPEGLADNITASLMGLEGVAPELSTAMATKTAQVVSALQQMAPLPSADSLLQPEAASWDMDDPAAARFASVAAAHLDPISVIEEALHGAADPLAVKVIKQHYAGLLESVTPRILESIALSKKKLSWRDKVALSILLDVPVDPLLTPDGIRRAQQVYAPPPQPGQGPQGIRASGLEQLGGMRSMFETGYQKTESIGESS